MEKHRFIIVFGGISILTILVVFLSCCYFSQIKNEQILKATYLFSHAVDLEKELMQQLYGEDVNWISDGKLTGVEAPKYREKADYGFSNQRGLHWPVVMPVSKDSAGS